MMSSLPLVWGEGASIGAVLQGDSAPSLLYREWQNHYDMTPVDSLAELSDSRADMLLLVQPPALPPADLADLDAWVRGGGLALILTDPDLHWPSDLPLGHPARPLSTGLLSPLLGHWGLVMVRQDGESVGRFMLAKDVAEPQAPADCFIGARERTAHCRVGKGRALLIADADFLYRGTQDDAAGEQVRQKFNGLIEDFRKGTRNNTVNTID